MTRKAKYLAILLILFLGFAAVLTGAFLPRAKIALAEDATPTALYQYFENVSAICADDSTVYIADGAVVYLYSAASHAFGASTVKVGPNAATPREVKGMAIGGGQLFVLEGANGNLAAYTIFNNDRTVPNFNPNSLPIAPAPSDGYTSVTILNERVFAAKDSFIYVFDNALQYQKTITATGPVLGLTAGTDIVYAIQSNGANFFVCSLDETTDSLAEIAVIGEPFEHLVFLHKEQLLTVFSRNSIVFYDAQTDQQKGTKLTRNDNAYLLSAGTDAFFAVNYDSSVSKISSDFKTETVLAASASNAPGFYNMPGDIASRNGKLYVSDRLNDRISINSDTVFSAIKDCIQPVSISADSDGYLYAAYNLRNIAKYDPTGKLINNPEIAPYLFAPGGTAKTILLLRADSKGNLYVLTTDRFLYKLATGATEFTPVYQNPDGSPGKVYGITAGLNNPEFYVAVRVNAADEHPKKIMRVTAASFESTGIENITDFVDMSADADGGIYILTGTGKNLQLSRYDYNKVSGVYNPNRITVPMNGSPSTLRISVSAIDSEQVTGYRDILVADAARHTVTSISCRQFGIDPNIQKEPPKLDDSLFPAGVFNTERLIRTISGADGCALFAGKNDVYPVKRFTNEAKTSSEGVRLPSGYKVIVPHYDAESDYSFVIADNTKYEQYGDYEILTGYVRNKYLSEPLAYTDDHPEKCVADYANGTTVYKYPSLQAPKLTGFTAVPKGTLFNFLDFVNDRTTERYGYYDNRNIQYENSIRWYRISFAVGSNLHEGFVDEDSVTVNGIPADSGKQLQTNAVIVSETSDRPNEGARVYFLNDAGEYVEDPMYSPLSVGKRIKVDGAFDSSKPYTKVIFKTDYGTVENRYVKTVNIRYDGINLLQPILICVIIATLLLTLILTVRHIKTRRKYIPKELIIDG